MVDPQVTVEAEAQVPLLHGTPAQASYVQLISTLVVVEHLEQFVQVLVPLHVFLLLDLHVAEQSQDHEVQAELQEHVHDPLIQVPVAQYVPVQDVVTQEPPEHAPVLYVLVDPQARFDGHEPGVHVTPTQEGGGVVHDPLVQVPVAQYVPVQDVFVHEPPEHTPVLYAELVDPQARFDGQEPGVQLLLSSTQTAFDEQDLHPEQPPQDLLQLAPYPGVLLSHCWPEVVLPTTIPHLPEQLTLQ